MVFFDLTRAISARAPWSYLHRRLAPFFGALALLSCLSTNSLHAQDSSPEVQIGDGAVSNGGELQGSGALGELLEELTSMPLPATEALAPGPVGMELEVAPTPQSLQEMVPPSSNRGTPTGSRDAAASTSIHDLQIELLETGYRLAKTDRSRGELIHALEGAVIRHCAPTFFKELQHKGAADSPACLQRVGRLVQLDAGNAVATCALLTFQNPRCAAAFQTQRVESYNPETPSMDPARSAPGEELQVKLQVSKNRAAIEQIRTELAGFARRMKQRPTPLEKMGFQKSAARLLRLTCVGDSVDSREAAAVTKPIARLPESQSTPSSALDGKLLSGPSAFDSPTPPPAAETTGPAFRSLAEATSNLSTTPSVRTRYITTLCAQTIESIRKVEPEHAGALCARDGVFTPVCLIALRKDRAVRGRNPTMPQSGRNDTLTKF